MSLLLFSFILEIGFSPMYYAEIYGPISHERIADENSMYTQLEIELGIAGFIFARGGVKTDVLKIANEQAFSPYESTYLFEGGVQYEGVEIGYRHLCIHPTMPYRWNYAPSTTIDGYYDEYYIKFSGGFNG